jgi:autotransporter-associated beta strand protein/T5SS/PEP-CTERM-associated repeat protein
MKRPIDTAPPPHFSIRRPLSTAIILSLSISVASATDWIGTTSTDWNTGSNWTDGAVPTGQNAIINNITGAIATISADLSVTPNDIDVRNGSRLDHLAGTAGTNGGAWMFVGQDQSAGTYNLANTSSPAGGITGFAQGAGSLNATGNLLVGAFDANRTGTVRVNTNGTLAVSNELFIGDGTNSVGTFLLESATMTVNNKIFVGNNQGIGTLIMSGGSLTKTGGDETFVGRDNGGTGTITQTGGSVTLNHNLYLGQNSGSNGTYNISGNALLNIGRDFAVGRESGTGTLHMTGGTIIKTGDEKFIVGHNNATGTVVQTGGTISANNELYIGNENAGASGTYTLSGTGALHVSNEVVVGREGGTGTLNVHGGTITTTANGNLYIGRRNGTGTLAQTDGTISVIKEFGVGTRDDNKSGTGTYNLSGGSLTAQNNIFIGKEQGSSGTMTMTSGTMATSDKLIVGHNQASGLLTQSGGTVTVQNEVYIGNENNASSVGTYTLSGVATLNVGNEVLVGRDHGQGTFNLHGGTVTTKKLEGGNGSAIVNFNGGTLKASQNESNFITNLGTANLQTAGALINSNGFNIGTSQIFTGIGGITKTGTGIFTLSAANSYNGLTAVNEGTLRLGINNAIIPHKAVTVAPTGASAVLDLAEFSLSIGGAGLTLGGATANSEASVINSAGSSTLTLSGGATAVTYNPANDPLGASISTAELRLADDAQTFTVGDSLNVGGLANELTVSSAITASGSNSALIKAGDGALRLDGTQGYHILTANAGTTNVNGPLTSGTAAVNVHGAGTTLRFGQVSQTLSSLTIGADATVIFTSGAASGLLAGGGGKAPNFGGAVVPEPTTLGLLLVGALGILHRRRRA